MQIGVTGGTGFIGSHLIELLLDKGFSVECLALERDIPGWLSGMKEIRFTIGDLLEPETIVEFVKRNDIIVHLAGLTRACTEEAFLLCNYTGTKNLVETILKHNPDLKQLIIMSSQAAVGPSRNGDYLTEDAPFRPISPYGKSKAMVEEFLSMHRHAIPCTIIRAPSVYGPRDRDFIELVRLIKHRIKPIMGGNARLSFVYVKNLIFGICAAIGNPKALGETFFITDEGSYTWVEFGALIEKTVNRKALPVYIPKPVVLIGYVISSILGLFSNKPILLTKYKIAEMDQPYWMVSNQKAKHVLGYSPVFSTEEGLRESVDWYHRNGWC